MMVPERNNQDVVRAYKITCYEATQFTMTISTNVGGDNMFWKTTSSALRKESWTILGIIPRNVLFSILFWLQRLSYFTFTWPLLWLNQFCMPTL